MKSYFYFLLSFLAMVGCSDKDNDAKKTIRIGGLYSLTGGWSTLGNASQAAMNIALEDVNAYLEQRGSAYQLSTVVSDTRLDTAAAKSAIQNGFEESGIKIFIGPQSSAELKSVKKYADENELIVISQGSTAFSLSIPDDGIFRFCPSDGPQGSAISKKIYSEGKRVIIILARNDAGNIGLQNSVSSTFKALGGSVDAIAPYATNLTNFALLLTQLKSKIQSYTSTEGADKVAVYLASFDEITDFFSQASTDPVFASVKWYGGDGVVLSEALLANTTARNFAVATSFYAPNFGLPSNPHPDLSRVASGIKAASGVDADAYALSVYDIMWVIGLTLANYPDVLEDYTELKSNFTLQAEQYYGITGPTILNVNGDRAIGSFEYWGIVNNGGVFKWAVVGRD